MLNIKYFTKQKYDDRSEQAEEKWKNQTNCRYGRYVLSSQAVGVAKNLANAMVVILKPGILVYCTQMLNGFSPFILKCLTFEDKEKRGGIKYC